MTHSLPTRLKAAALGASALVALTGAAHADQVFNDDVIITQSLCVGNDCVNGEAFGFDTIRLKENNTRIKFDDTSNSSSFPNNDWQLTANDSANGGANKFSIDDITNARTPFTVTAAAPSNSIFVNSSGNVGFSTGTPVVQLHVVDGDSPALRLEQDGSSGFTAQTWDLAGNETNFFVRDVTNGSKLPFRIRPNAPGDSIYVAANGNIGMGTASPDTALNIKRAGDVIIDLTNATSGVSWEVKNQEDKFRITVPPGGANEVEFELNEDGDLALSGLLSIRDGVTAPTSTSLQAQIYVDSADGDLKVIFSDGTVKTLATDS